jgi:hypothetical protein
MFIINLIIIFAFLIDVEFFYFFFGKRYKEHLPSFKYNKQNSKFAQHAIETGHEFGKRNAIVPIKFLGKKGRHLHTTQKFYIKKPKIIIKLMINIESFTTKYLKPF